MCSSSRSLRGSWVSTVLPFRKYHAAPPTGHSASWPKPEAPGFSFPLTPCASLTPPPPCPVPPAAPCRLTRCWRRRKTQSCCAGCLWGGARGCEEGDSPEQAGGSPDRAGRQSGLGRGAGLGWPGLARAGPGASRFQSAPLMPGFCLLLCIAKLFWRSRAAEKAAAAAATKHGVARSRAAFLHFTCACLFSPSLHSEAACERCPRAERVAPLPTAFPAGMLFTFAARILQ